jgi:hypothetical protein
VLGDESIFSFNSILNVDETIDCSIASLSTTRCNSFNGKDLTGFIDGTVNPDQNMRSSVNMAIRSDGSSQVFISKFIHNLKAFEALNLEHKNAIIGRNISTISRHQASDGRLSNPRSGPGCGDKRGHVFRSWGQMLRLAMPFSSSMRSESNLEDKKGLFFVATSAEPSSILDALHRMCGHYAVEFDGGKGSVDNLFKITKAESAAYLFVPSLPQMCDFIKALIVTNKLNTSFEVPYILRNEDSTFLPPELNNLRKVLDPSGIKSIIPDRIINYEMCVNCEAEQSVVYEGSKSLLKYCMMCRQISFIQ